MFVYMCINSQYSSYPQVSTLAPCIGFGLLVHRPVGLQNDKNDKKFVETTIKPVYFRVYSPCKLHQIWVNHVFFNTKPEFIHLCDENVHPSPDPPGMDPRFAQVLRASAPDTVNMFNSSTLSLHPNRVSWGPWDRYAQCHHCKDGLVEAMTPLFSCCCSWSMDPKCQST